LTGDQASAGTPVNTIGKNITLVSSGDVGIGTKIPQAKLHVTGNIKSLSMQPLIGVQIASSTLFRENVVKIDNPLEKIKRISAYKYNLSDDAFKGDSTSGSIPPYTQPLIGFLGQEVERAFPELVSRPDSIDNYYKVNYTGMIPVLVEAIKEQQTQIEGLQTQITDLLKTVSEQSTVITTLQETSAKHESYFLELFTMLEECCRANPEYTPPSYILPDNGGNGNSTGLPTTSSQTANTSSTSNAKLFQNIPNPFSVNTEICFEIPESANSAKLLIHDMQGAEIKSFPVTSKGAGNIIIQGSELSAGMYMYTLLINNTIVDTKKMILTK
jgi:hypothetical protein